MPKNITQRINGHKQNMGNSKFSIKLILLLTFLTVFITICPLKSFPQKIKKDTVFVIRNQSDIDISNLNKEYINYLKEVSEANQKRFETNFNNYSNYLMLVSLLLAVFTLLVGILTGIGVTKLKKIKKLSEDANACLSRANDIEVELRKMLEVNNGKFTKTVRDKVVNKILHEKADTFFRLKQYEIANEITQDILRSPDFKEEDAVFKNEITLLCGRIKYELEQYEESIGILKLIVTDDIKYKILINDLIGANYQFLCRRNKDLKTCSEGNKYFEKAYDLTEDRYDKKRFLSNIQITYRILGRYDEIIGVYKKIKSIVIGLDSKGEENDRNLEVGIYITTILAKWHLKKKIDFQKMTTEVLEKFGFETIDSLKNYVIENLNSKLYIDPVELEELINDYKYNMEKI